MNIELVSLRRSQALVKAMSNDYLFREQWVTNPAGVSSDYVHGVAADPESAEVANQLIYAIVSDDHLFRWLRARAGGRPGKLDNQSLARELVDQISRSGDRMAISALVHAGSSEKVSLEPALDLIRSIIGGRLRRGESGTEFTPGTGTEFTPGTGTEFTPGTGTEFTPGTGTEFTPGTGTEMSPGTGTGTEMSPGTGTEFTPGTGTGTEMSPGTGTEVSPGTGTGTEVSPGTGTGTEVSPGTGTGTEVSPGTGTGTEVSPGTGTGTEVSPGTGTGTEVSPGTGTGTEVSPGTGTGTEVSPGTGTGTESSLGGLVGRLGELEVVLLALREFAFEVRAAGALLETGFEGVVAGPAR